MVLFPSIDPHGDVAEQDMLDRPEPLLVAIDGGATGTRVRLGDATGRTLAEATAGPSSLTLGVDQAWRHIRAALSDALAQLGLDFDALAAARIGGALAGSRNARNLAAFRRTNPLDRPVEVMTDGYAGLVGGLGGRPGTVVAVGTGVAAHRLWPDGTSKYCSGWGFPAGDEGGGAWIGLQSVHVLLRTLDGRDRKGSALAERLGDVLGRDVDTVQQWLQSAPATKYASLAPIAVDAAAAGDTVAKDILGRAGGELAAAVAALDGTDPAPAIALVGGLAAPLTPFLPDDLAARLTPAVGGVLEGMMLILTGKASAEVVR